MFVCEQKTTGVLLFTAVERRPRCDCPKRQKFVFKKIEKAEFIGALLG
jgi:hypothetical protein